MKNNLRFLLITAFMAIASVVVIGLTSFQTNNEIASLVDTSAIKSGAVAGVQTQGEAQLTINYGDKMRHYDFQVDQVTTAYELLERASIKENLTIEAQEYKDLGVLVDGINEYKGGDDGKYWLLYVNDQASLLAIDKTMVKPGDKVELRFEKSPY